MYKLARQIRFSVNPFLTETVRGNNSFSAKPTGTALAIYLAVTVEVTGQVDPSTGFLVNITEIDTHGRSIIVPMFEKLIKTYYHTAKHIGFDVLADLMKNAASETAKKLKPLKICSLGMHLNPSRTFWLKSGKNLNDPGDKTMKIFSEKFEFAAMHTLWNDQFSDEENFRIFGKCANPAGHGHNYTLEVSVELDDCASFDISNFQTVIQKELVELLDHKNLNVDVPILKDVNPTVENIATFAYSRLEGNFRNLRLHEVKIWETDKTCCSYSKL